MRELLKHEIELNIELNIELSTKHIQFSETYFDSGHNSSFIRTIKTFCVQ